MRPVWKHRDDDRCNGARFFGLQLAYTLLLDIAAYWVPAEPVKAAITTLQRRLGGRYLAMHVRRSQSWVPNEMKGWRGGGWPDVTLPAETLIQIVRHELLYCRECGNRVFVATNSRNLSERAMIDSAHNLSIVRFNASASPGLSSFQVVAVDNFVAALGAVFTETPGSTTAETVRHVHSARGFSHPRAYTFCQYRAELPRLWPECPGLLLQHRGCGRGHSSVRCPCPILRRAHHPPYARGIPRVAGFPSVVNLSAVLMTITFSFPFYQSIPLLKWMYQHFGRLYFCGERGSTRPPGEVHVVPVNNGWYQHRCLLRAMAEHPGFQGYIGGNDDLLVQPWVVATWTRGTGTSSLTFPCKQTPTSVAASLPSFWTRGELIRVAAIDDFALSF